MKISDCPLVKDGQVKNLNVNHPVRREWLTFFRDLICDKVEKTVMCCSEEEMSRVSFSYYRIKNEQLKFRYSKKATKSNLKTLRTIGSNFCGLLRKPEL